MPPIDLILNVAVGGILTGLVYGLMALGLSVIFGVIRVVNFAHGEMMTVAMFLAFSAFTALGIDPLLSLIPIAALLFAFGYAMQAGLINDFVNKPEHTQFILLVAVAIILVNVLLMIFGPDARGVQTDYSFDSFEVGTLIVDATKAYAALAAVLVALVLFAFFRFTLIGQAIRACADNYTGALVVGLDVKRLYALTFGIGAACVGAAGSVLVLITDVTPALGPSYTLQAFIIVIIGGLGSMPGALLGGVLIGLTEALAGLFFTPSAKSMFAVAALVLVLLLRPQGIMGETAAMTGLFSELSKRGIVLLVLLLALMLAAPFLANDYLLTVLILILYFAFTGQAWNVMMGFAGQLSLGHALYVGLAAYVSAALFVHFGIGPWIGMLAAVPVGVIAGAIIGFLAFRFRVGGVYFAILTIAFAEFTRVGFDHFSYVGGSGGFFLPVSQYTSNDLLNLRGNPTMFYYVILAMTLGAWILCRWLLRSRLGYFWQAIREDEDAARALGIDTFRCKMIAVMISAGLTAPAGVFTAFYYNNLFPEQVFNMGRSIEIILGPIIGGVGTLFGPILGAFLLTGLSEFMHELLSWLGLDVPGAKAVFYGICLLFVVVALPDGVWPWVARKLKVTERKP